MSGESLPIALPAAAASAGPAVPAEYQPVIAGNPPLPKYPLGNYSG